MSLFESLDRLLESLTTRGSPVAQHLLPGLSPGEVLAVTKEAGLEVHPSVVELFTWRNGLDLESFESDIDAPMLVPSLSFAPLSAACSIYRLQIETNEERRRLDLEQDHLWPDRWFPVFCFSEHAVVDCGNEQPGAMFTWTAPWGGANERIFKSLEQCVDTVRYLVESGEAMIDDGRISLPAP